MPGLPAPVPPQRCRPRARPRRPALGLALAGAALASLAACGGGSPTPRPAPAPAHSQAHRADPRGAPPADARLALRPTVRLQLAAAHPSHDGLVALQRDLVHEMRLAGPGSGAVVYDYTTRRLLFATRANTVRPPASVEKLYTSAAALELLGPGATLSTTVLGAGSLDARGTWHGDLYVHGGGDPTLGAGAFNAVYTDGQGADIATLARRVAAAGIRRVSGHLIADESLFDTERGPVAYDGAVDLSDLGGQLSALTYDHGYVGRSPGRNWRVPLTPATYATLELARALGRVGVRAQPAQSARRAPAGAQVLAAVSSPPLSVLLGLMDRPSDDFYAELLLKQLGVRYGTAGTSSAGAAVVSRVLAGYGLHPRVVDGSGLSRRDASTPRDVVQLLVDLTATGDGAILRRSLAVAGMNGTLAARMRHTPAAGRCEAKTGTLDAVTNLAGWCRDRNGHLLVFAVFMDGVTAFQGHALQDNMLITLARDDPSRP